MPQTDHTYLEKKLDALVKKDKNHLSFIFQIEKIKMDNKREVLILKDMEKQLSKEINVEEDALHINIEIPSSYQYGTSIQRLPKKDRLKIIYQLIHKVKDHRISRLHLFISPENIVVDQGLTPYFLHYGVKESLPPYERNEVELWLELKALAASWVDVSRSFEDYLQYEKTLELSEDSKKVLEAESFDSLLAVIDDFIKKEKDSSSLYIEVTKKKWKWFRNSLIAVSVLLVPAIIYSFYSIFFLQPKQSKIITAQEQFLSSSYSDVINTLQPYKIDELPKVAKYELATAYISNENLTDEQKQFVRNTVTLQSDAKYLDYWIQIGRGEGEEALKTARFLEETDLIVFALINYRENISGDESMDSEERQQKMDEIDREIKEYEQEEDSET